MPIIDSELYQDLQREIDSGHCVVIAGTGISVAVSNNFKIRDFPVATWPGLIRHGIATCVSANLCDLENAAFLERQVSLGQTDYLIQAADTVTKLLRRRSPGVYERWLLDSLGKLPKVHPELVQALAALPAILATLNYDSLIEQITDRRPVLWNDESRVQRVLKGDIKDAVLHLHGYYEDSKSVVLDSESYWAVRNDPHSRAVLESLLLHKTLLFVGCAGTLEDPNFSRLIDWARETMKDSPYRHFLLCTADEKERMRDLTRDAPWLHPFVFGKVHDDLVPFLHSLAAATSASPSSITRKWLNDTLRERVVDVLRYALPADAPGRKARLQDILGEHSAVLRIDCLTGKRDIFATHVLDILETYGPVDSPLILLLRELAKVCAIDWVTEIETLCDDLVTTAAEAAQPELSTTFVDEPNHEAAGSPEDGNSGSVVFNNNPTKIGKITQVGTMHINGNVNFR